MPQEIRVRLLGGFSLARGEAGTALPADEADEEALPLRSERLRMLLAYLALRPGQRCRRQALAFAFWPDSTEKQARANLRNLLFQLRRHEERIGRVLVEEADGDLALARPHWLDALAFEAALARAARAEEAGAIDAALGAREEALALYRGDLLPELYEDWIDPERRRLRDAMEACRARLLAALLASDRANEALDLAGTALAEDPLDESAHRGRMAAYLALGDRAGALIAYQRCAEVLQTELGVDPAEETELLHARIRTGGRDRPAPLPPANPYRRVPRALTSFVGRGTELAELRALLGQSRLVTLTGAGGVGKSRLAQQLAQALRAEGRGAEILWLDLREADDAEALAELWATALGLQLGPGPADQALIAAAEAQLGARPALLVLDSAERTAEASAALAGKLLHAAPGLGILCVSREALHAESERIFRLHGLPSSIEADGAAGPEGAPSGGARGAGEAASDDAPPVGSAAVLFAERAAQVAPGFRLGADNATAVVELCRRLDGLPLAIELAAAQARALSPEEILAHLDDALALLVGGGEGGAARHRTMRQAIAWSYSLLPEDEKALFRRLSVFEGGFELDAARALHDDAQAHREDLLPLLRGLLDKSLAEKRGAGHPSRYGLLTVLRQYAGEALRAEGEEAAVRPRHAAHFLALAEASSKGLQGPEQQAWRDRLDREQANLRAALRFGAEAEAAAPDLLPRLVVAMTRFWLTRGQVREGRRWWARAQERARSRAEALDPALRARLWTAASSLSFGLGENERGREEAETALALARDADDRDAAAYAEGMLGLHAMRQGDVEAARAHLRSSLDAHRALGDEWAASVALSYLGQLHYMRRDLEAARPLFQESLAAKIALGDERGEAHARANVALVQGRSGDRRAAAAVLEQSIDQLVTIGDLPAMADLYVHLGDQRRALGELEAARAAYERSLAIRRRLELRSAAARVVRSLQGLAELEREAAGAATGAAEATG